MENKLVQTLRDGGTKFVRLLWCDNANVIRSKAIYISALPDFLEHGVGLAISEQALPVMYDTLIRDAGLGPVGEIRLVPDWATLTPLPYATGHARVLSNMVSQGKPWDSCPRSFLLRTIADTAREGLQIKAAYETEFYLLQPITNAIVPTDETVFAQTLAMDINHALINEICEFLEAQNVPVEQYYPESGPGQHEITMRYGNAQDAADRQIVFRETVHAVARRFGVRASFLPKIFADRAGSGCHLHLSLWNKDQNLISDPQTATGVSSVAGAFIAGILKHLPALMALTAPTPNSYRRLRPHTWSGAFACWGLDNREAAIRIPENPAGGATNFELRSGDATANPYLALGAVITAGMDGVRSCLELGEPLTSDPGYLSTDEMAAKGVVPLPTNLPQAIASLEQDELLLDALGPRLAKSYLAVRKAESEFLSGLDLEDEVKLLAERY